MRWFELTIAGLQEAVAELGEPIAVGVMERLSELAGVESVRYDPDAHSILVGMPDFTESHAGPSFAQLSQLVQDVGNALERPLSVSMIHRTPG